LRLRLACARLTFLVPYTADNLVFRSRRGLESGVVNRVTAGDAGWKDLSAEIRTIQSGARWKGETGLSEAVIVLLGGRCSVTSNRGTWNEIGRRRNVFDGMPWALYLPKATTFEVAALDDHLELAYGSAPTGGAERAPRLVTPRDVRVEVRGGHNNTRQINSIIPPGFDCDRLVCVEVYTPSGNWSSYPPHKHDVHREENGTLIEADLEELYCYKMSRPEGWALQRIYTEDRSTDASVVAKDGDIVLVPEGYHPVCTGYGYDCYYLNFLAGSAQSLACTDDPEHAWVKETWTATDPRVPMVTLEMEKPVAP